MFNICRIFLYGLPCDIFAPPWYNKDAGSLPALDGTERRRSSAFFRLPGAGYKTPARKGRVRDTLIRPYTIDGKPYILENTKLQALIKSKARAYLNMVERGVLKSPLDILSAREKLCADKAKDRK